MVVSMAALTESGRMKLTAMVSISESLPVVAYWKTFLMDNINFCCHPEVVIDKKWLNMATYQGHDVEKKSKCYSMLGNKARRNAIVGQESNCFHQGIN